MGYWLIVAALALALMPLLRLAPSRSQRRLARLREQAAVAGLFVELRRPPPAPRGAVKADERTAGVFYGRRLPPGRAQRPPPGLWSRTAQGWIAVGDSRRPPPALDELPATVTAASIDFVAAGVYWSEAGEPSDVDRIAVILGQLAHPGSEQI